MSVATAVSPSGTLSLVGPVTRGAAGPATLALAAADNGLSSNVQTAPVVPQARPAGSVITTSESPHGITVTVQSLPPEINRFALLTQPPSTVSRPFVNAEELSLTSRLNRNQNSKPLIPS